MKLKKLKLNRKKIVLAVAVLLIFALASSYFLFFKTPSVQAGWWNDSWQYRKAISIGNTSGAELADFQVLVLSNVNLVADINAGKIRPDLGDLRFVDAVGDILPYWIEDITATTTVNAWVKATTLPVGGATIYLYYGNPSAISAQNGNNVFLFFDDFSGDAGKWTVDSGTWSIANGEYVGSGTGFFSKATGYTFTDGVIEARQKVTSGAYYHGLFFRYADSGNFYGLTVTGAGDRDYILKKVSGALTESSYTAVYTGDNAYHKIKAIVNGTSLGFYKDGSLVAMTLGTNPLTDASFSSGKIALGGFQLAGQVNTDWIFVVFRSHLLKNNLSSPMKAVNLLNEDVKILMF